ncbi:MAG: YciI family protein [Candidatus Endonucleobacter bathymodioli]|uniref:YciI family protein n=1 Tax=Candidatus Endonucleibacter bathymodioli TaxID=539814 RepID=A0AA90P106_9GAMM|nr:YciI family protein [Candidatus Endonucleobacter bathymodioli]
MLYAIISDDVEHSLPLRQKARHAHLARLEALNSMGRLVIAGPCPAIDSSDPGAAGFSGSLVLAEFGSIDEAQAWANTDPYIEAGVYHQVIVKPFKQVFP